MKDHRDTALEVLLGLLLGWPTMRALSANGAQEATERKAKAREIIFAALDQTDRMACEHADAAARIRAEERERIADWLEEQHAHAPAHGWELAKALRTEYAGDGSASSAGVDPVKTEMLAALKEARPVLKEAAYHELDGPRRARMRAAATSTDAAIALAEGKV